MQDKSPRRVMTVDDVHDELGIAISTQRLWRAEGRFVPWFYAGKRLVYRRELVERWVAQQEASAAGAATSDDLVTDQATAEDTVEVVAT